MSRPNREEPPVPDCGHAADLTCHRNQRHPCPVHFSACVADVMEAVAGSGETAGASATSAVSHLNRDGYMAAAWLTWMAMLGWMAGGTRSPDERLRRAGRSAEIGLPPDAPDHVREALPLLKTATRAAALADGANAEAALYAAVDQLSSRAVLCFLTSAAGSAGVVYQHSPAFTENHMRAFVYLGSQVSCGTGMVVLPYLVEMVVAAQRDEAKQGVAVFQRLVDLPTVDPLIIALEIVCRTLAQSLSRNLTVMAADDDEFKLLDVQQAGKAGHELPRELMAGVWAVRAAEAYASSATEMEAAERVRELSRAYGSAGLFTTDVVLASVQILATDLAAVTTRSGPGGR